MYLLVKKNGESLMAYVAIDGKYRVIMGCLKYQEFVYISKLCLCFVNMYS